MGKSLKLILASALCMLVSTACGGNSKQEAVANEQTTSNETATMAKDGKALVVFFSHAGDNYAVGNIEVGNTKIVADYISEITGAEQFEIVTHKYDGMAYTPLINMAKEEANKGELPEYEGDIDLTKYDTVFIGGPVWWGTYPQVMFTFFKKHGGDLKGKTVIPFTTHEGSGLANCVEDVKEAFPGANVQKGFSIYGHEVRTERGKVEKWLKGLGYLQHKRIRAMQNFDYMVPTCLVFGIDAALPKQEIAEKAIDATYAFFESINIKEILLA